MKKNNKFIKEVEYRYMNTSSDDYVIWFNNLSITQKKTVFNMGRCFSFRHWYNINWLPDGYYLSLNLKTNKEHIFYVKNNRISLFEIYHTFLISEGKCFINGGKFQILLRFDINDLKQKFRIV